MQLTGTTLAILFSLLPAISAAPTGACPPVSHCVNVYPTYSVPIDSSAPTRVYGSSTSVTLWNALNGPSSGQRSMLFAFENIPADATKCKLHFQAAASPPLSIAPAEGVDVNAYLLKSTVQSTNSWAVRPEIEGLAGSGHINVSKTEKTDVVIVDQGCRAGAMNYQIDMVTVGGKVNFDAQEGTRFYMTYNC